MSPGAVSRGVQKCSKIRLPPEAFPGSFQHPSYLHQRRSVYFCKEKGKKKRRRSCKDKSTTSATRRSRHRACIAWRHRCWLLSSRRCWTWCCDVGLTLSSCWAPQACFCVPTKPRDRCRRCARCRPDRSLNGSGKRVAEVGWCLIVAARAASCNSRASSPAKRLQNNVTK